MTRPAKPARTPRYRVVVRECNPFVYKWIIVSRRGQVAQSMVLYKSRCAAKAAARRCLAAIKAGDVDETGIA